MDIHQPPKNDKEWKEIIIRLEAFAEDQISLYTWFRGENALPIGYTAEDFVQDTIMYYIEHPEKYDSKRGAFLPYLKWNILRRMVSNFCKGPENRDGLDIFHKTGSDEDGNYEYENYLPVELLTIDCKLDFKKIVETVIDLIDGDPIVEKVFEGLFINNLKRVEICKQYKLTDNDYANGLRRLTTKMKTVTLLVK